MELSSPLYTKTLYGRQIRLLQLQKGNNGEPVQCSLVYRSLAESIVYNALSYVWGDPKPTAQIICDGAPRYVTNNLYQALHRVRQKYPDTLLWADAICINQANTDEKTRQVRMMGDIYMQADKVVIWLGEEEPGDRKGYELAYELGQLLGDTIADIHGVVASLNRFEEYDSDTALAALLEKGQEWNHLDRLLARPWFTRVWIIQELVMARSTVMLSGDFVMDPNVLLNFASLDAIHPAISGRTYLLERPEGLGYRKHFSCVDSLRGLVATWRLTHNLILSDVLALTTESKAQDPRDHIFALVGLSKDIPPEFIDYSRDMPSLVTDLAARMIFQTKFPTRKICLPQILETHSTKIPSWATDWTGSDVLTEPMTFLVPFDWSYNSEDPKIRLESDTTLVMCGKIVDRIEEIVLNDLSDQKQNPVGLTVNREWMKTSTRQLYTWVQDVFDLCDRKYGSHTAPAIEEAIWRSLICDGAPYQYPAPPEYKKAYQAWLSYMRDWPRYGDRILDYKESGEDPPDELCDGVIELEEQRVQMAPIEKTFSRAKFGRLFCVTKSGYMGWVPRFAKLGDEVVAFENGHVPFIMRRVDKEEEKGEREEEDTTQSHPNDPSKAQPRRRLIGDCYLHGMVGRRPRSWENFPTEEIFLI